MSVQPEKNRKPKFEVPDTYALIMLFVITAAILTYILPAGEFASVKQGARTVIDPASYKFIKPNPVGLMDVLKAVPQGLVRSASIIFMIFMVGGCFYVINQTRAVDAGFGLLIDRMEKRALWIIPAVMLPLCYLGSVGMMANSVVAFIPVGLAIAKRLNIDPVAGAAMMYLGNYAGFCTGALCPVTTAVAQQIAGIPVFSG